MSLILITLKAINLILENFIVITNLISYYFDINIVINDSKLNKIIDNLYFFYMRK